MTDTTSGLKKVFLAGIAKIHTIHPAVILPLVAVGGWLIAPGLGIGDTNKPAPIEQVGTAANRVIDSVLGSKSAETSNPAAVAPTSAPVVVATAPATGGGIFGGLFGGNQSSSGNTGGASGGASGSSGGSSSPSKPQGQAQSSLPAKTTTPEVGATHSVPAWTQPNTPPGTASVAPTQHPVTPGPAMPAPPQHMAGVVPPPPAPPPVVIPLPFPLRPGFGRPPIIRAPLVIMRHR